MPSDASSRSLRARCVLLEFRLGSSKPPEGSEFREAKVERKRKESLPSRSVSCGDQAAAAGRGGTAGGAESTALSLRLACFFLNPGLRPPALSSSVDVAFPSDTKPTSYPGVAA